MANPTTAYFPFTGDAVIDGMTSGYYWLLDGTKTVDYSISDGFFSEYWIDPSAVIDSMSTALSFFSYYANVSFSYSGYFLNPYQAALGGSEINLSVDGDNIFFSNNNIWAIGNFPNPSTVSNLYYGQAGDIFLNLNSAANTLPSYEPGSQGFFLLLHELGHTLGLKHPHDDGGTGRPTFSQLGIANLDIDFATIMSYNDDASWNQFSWDPATPMVLDVIALQYLYGINNSTNAGNTTFQLSQVGYYYTLWDAAGVDTLDASGANSGWTILLPDQPICTLVDTKCGVAAPTVDFIAADTDTGVPTTLVWLTGDYENIIGSSYSDVLNGNQFSNLINGGAGADIIDGSTGADILIGGTGDDTYVVDNAGDVADETGGDGTDTVQSSVTFSLSDAVHAKGLIENLTLTSTTAINGTGNALANIITGNGGNNILAGLGGADQLTGGAGTGDTATYAASAAGVNVSLMTGAGSGGDAEGDTLSTIENLTGSNLDDTLEGNALNNVLAGGTNGVGGDTVSYEHLLGAVGVTVSLALATAQNTLGAGTDTLTGFENLTGSGFNDTLTGNSGNNVLRGLTGNDTLNGGTGLDTMFGGTGNDTYVVDNSGDIVDESDGDGIDTIQTSLSFSLVAMGAIENLTLTGTTAINGTGNDLNNIITGNTGVNTLTGLGGNDTLNGLAGADILIGGTGDDTYVVDNAGDVADETGGDGTDIPQLLQNPKL